MVELAKRLFFSSVPQGQLVKTASQITTETNKQTKTHKFNTIQRAERNVASSD